MLRDASLHEPHPVVHFETRAFQDGAAEKETKVVETCKKEAF